jgi:hypothetical protein
VNPVEWRGASADTSAGRSQMQTRIDIQAKVERYGLLRSALRAIDGSSPDGGGFGLHGSFQQVRGWLLELRSSGALSAQGGAARISSAHFELLENVDRMLDELQRMIVEQVRSIPLSQLRATLPAIKRQHPEALKALLDLCLISHASGSAWPNLVDYLITLLVCEEAEDGRRYVAQDPTLVTPRMQQLCAASDRDKAEVTSALAEMFRNACDDVERGVPAGPIIDQMRSAKHQAMETLLVPELLRAITAYNVAVANQRTELIETQRTLEEAELEAFEESLGSPRSAQPLSEPEPTPVAPQHGNALDSPSLRAVVTAIGWLLRGGAPEQGPASELAAALDRSKLSAYEAAALRDPEPSPVTAIVATAVSVGLILRNIGALGDRLARAGISAEQLQTEWIPELENRMGAEAAALMTGDGYDEARRIAEVRTRQLRKPESEVNVWRLERDEKQREVVSFARKPPATPASSVEEKTKARFRGSPGRWPAVAASIVCAIALGAGANYLFASEEDTGVAFFSEGQLEAVSIYIASGYRNGRGDGPAFVGTLRPQWAELSPVERSELGQAIEKKLLAQGISEFMLFDGRRELMLQRSKGRLEVH